MTIWRVESMSQRKMDLSNSKNLVCNLFLVRKLNKSMIKQHYSIWLSNSSNHALHRINIIYRPGLFNQTSKLSRQARTKGFWASCIKKRTKQTIENFSRLPRSIETKRKQCFKQTLLFRNFGSIMAACISNRYSNINT